MLTRRNAIAFFATSMAAASSFSQYGLAQTSERAQKAPAPTFEFDDIQHLVMARVPAITGRYEFLSFRQPEQGRAWLRGITDKVASVQQARDSIEREQRWVAVAFTWQ